MTWHDWMQRLRVALRRQRPVPRRRASISAASRCIETLEARSLLTINFVFDYSLDTQGFFSSSQARSLLEQAGTMLGSALNDSLLAISPNGGNTWTAQFSNPSSGSLASLNNLTVAANKLLIFAGARDLTGGSVAEGAPGGYSGNGSDSWFDVLAARGQTGALPTNGQVASDFGPWGGSLTFDSAGTDWFMGSSITEIGTNQMDFLSVAQHELGHLLGFGTAESFDRYVAGNSFTGPNARAAYDGVGEPFLSGDRAHWQDGTTDNGQTAAMDPSLPPGTRRLFTGLDFAALKDIGWNANSDGSGGGGGGGGGGTGTVVVTAGSNLLTTESGGSASFTVALSVQPTADVTINLSSSNINEGNASTSTLVFTPQNWSQAQTVVVTGVDDLILDGNQSYKIVTAAAVSSDTRFNGVNPADVTLTNIDNDNARIVVTPTSGLITTEQGGTSSFTVSLTSQPSFDVTINLSSSNTREGTISDSTLVFTPLNWLTPQLVTVTGVDDHVSDSSKAYTIILNTALSGDPAYGGINPPDVSVVNISLPDLKPTITVSESESVAWSTGVPVLLDSTMQVNDPDSPFLNISGAKLIVSLSRNGTSSDRFSILNEGTGRGQVGNASGSNNITYQGIVVGVRSGGTGTTPLTITFNSRATLAIVQEVARNLQFRTSTSNKSSLDRSVALTFVMSDGTTSNVATKLVHVVTGATPPVINLGPSALPYTNRSGAQLISPAASLTDIDSLNFGGGKLTVQLTAGAAAGDALRIRRQGRGAAQIDAALDGTVRFGKTIVGTWSGGTNGRALTVTLKSTASLAAVQALIRNITFETSATNASLASRTVQFQVTDGDGGTSDAMAKAITVA